MGKKTPESVRTGPPYDDSMTSTCLKIESLRKSDEHGLQHFNTTGLLTCSQISTPRIGTCATEISNSVRTQKSRKPKGRVLTKQRVLVSRCHNLELLRLRVEPLEGTKPKEGRKESSNHRTSTERDKTTHKPAPSATLNGSGLRVELLLKFFN